jgi:hypothetical protein
MQRSFEHVWVDFRRRLKPNTTIQSWSIRSGYTGGEFRIDTVGAAAIIVIPEGGKPRSVAKEDFRTMYALWPGYKAGLIGRAELRDQSQNTTYILSLFHWCDLTWEEGQGEDVPAEAASFESEER